MAKPKTIDEYLAGVSPDRRALLEKLRRTIHESLPDVEECISYSMPAFRMGKHVVAGFLATAKGCSYFPFSGTTLATLAEDLKRFDRTKSALHFDSKHLLPAALIRKLLKARLAETEPAPAPAQRSAKKAARRVISSPRTEPKRRARN